MWKRSMVGIMRHRQTKEPETDRPSLNHRATSRLYHAHPWVAGQVPAGNQIKAATKEQRHQCHQFSEPAVLKVIPLTRLEVVTVTVTWDMKHEIIEPVINFR
jgi:hypothetical protein